jgi:asparagine synthase (glutamine-hydrolysing)
VLHAGEIYNHKALKAQIKEKHPDRVFATDSDCEVISHLYEDYGDKVASMLDGMFSFCILDKNSNTFYAARDPMGITSLYIGWGKDGSVWVSSEMKCLKDDCTR